MRVFIVFFMKHYGLKTISSILYLYLLSFVLQIQALNDINIILIDFFYITHTTASE